MRTRNWNEKDRTQAIQDHYRKKAIKWKTRPSSEDVWEVREEPVRDAFQSNLEELEAQIAEWQKANPGAPDPWKQYFECRNLRQSTVQIRLGGIIIMSGHGKRFSCTR
jgi:hypothetical protein